MIVKSQVANVANSTNAQCYRKEEVDWRNWEFRRGEIYLINFGDEGIIGSEYKNKRPAVILSNDMNNKYSEILQVAPITSQKKTNLPVHVKLGIEDGLKLDNSIISIEQTRCVSKKRTLLNGSSIIRITKLSKNKMDLIDSAIKIQFGLV